MSREEPITETAWIQSALPSSVPRIKSNHPILPRSSLLVCKTRNKCTDPAALPEPGEVLILFIRGNIFFPPRGVCSLGKEGENGLWCWYYSSSANVLWTCLHQPTGAQYPGYPYLVSETQESGAK